MITHRLVKGMADIIRLDAKVRKAELRGGVDELLTDGHPTELVSFPADSSPNNICMESTTETASVAEGLPEEANGI